MPNQRIPPSIRPIGEIILPHVEVDYLDNGIPVYRLHQPEKEIFSLEIVIDGGRPYEDYPLVGRLTQLMLKEGSVGMTAGQLAEEIDFFGGSLHIPFDLDTTALVLTGLQKHFKPLVSKVAEVLLEPAFRQKDLSEVVGRSLAHLKVELDKNETVAYREITEVLFGAKHPYGYNSTEALYTSIGMDQIRRHYNQCYHAQGMRMYLAGRASEAELSVINAFFGKNFGNPLVREPRIPEVDMQIGHFSVSGMGEKQTAIRLGRLLFNRAHPDYHDLKVLNTILGGYFGSRLMTNIREEKGYTYNVYSSLDTMRFGGCWLIALETSPEKTKACLTEIHNEMVRLQQEPLEEEELVMVKNYLLGNMLSQIDGPMHTMEFITGLINDGLPFSFFAETVANIKEITPLKLQEIAKLYLSPTDWSIVEVLPSK
ncbi:MAG: insulinase family protein [Saprospiraceae bacterium]|nr:insulinase family protein [Saprospiraceae bacterium]